GREAEIERTDRLLFDIGRAGPAKAVELQHVDAHPVANGRIRLVVAASGHAPRPGRPTVVIVVVGDRVDDRPRPAIAGHDRQAPAAIGRIGRVPGTRGFNRPGRLVAELDGPDAPGIALTVQTPFEYSEAPLVGALRAV